MTPTARGRRWRVIILSTVLVLLVAYSGCDYWAGRRVANAIGRIEAKYGVLGTMTPNGPDVPAPENRAKLVEAAAALVNPGTNQERTAVYAFVSDPKPKTVSPEMRAYMKTNAEAIAMARQFVMRTRTGFGENYQSGQPQLPLLNMRNLSNVIYVATLESLEEHRIDDAAALIAAGLSMSAATRYEPNLITQLIRIAVADAPVDALQRLFEQGDPSKASLEALARAFAENRETQPMTIGLMGEIGFVHSNFATLEAGRTNGTMVSNMPWSVASPFTRVMRPVIRWTHGRYLDEALTLLDDQTGPRPRAPRGERPRPPVWAFMDRLAHGFTLGLARAMQSEDDFASEQAAAELVVALRRFKLDHSAYPDSLDALAPAYVASVPIDPFTGKAPGYAREGDGFALTVNRSDTFVKNKRPLPVWKIAK